MRKRALSFVVSYHAEPKRSVSMTDCDTSSRTCVHPWQRPCITAVMWDQERTTRHGDRRLPGRRRNHGLLSDVRPQERVQRRTVEQLVVAAPGLPALDAPVPLVVEQLADVLPFVEAKEREEDARMDLLEDMMFSDQSVSAADREAWRRWAQAGSTQRRRRRKKKEKLPKTSLRHAARVPVHRQCAGHSSCMQRQWYAQCKTVQKTVKIPQRSSWDCRRRQVLGGSDSAENCLKGQLCRIP